MCVKAKEILWGNQTLGNDRLVDKKNSGWKSIDYYLIDWREKETPLKQMFRVGFLIEIENKVKSQLNKRSASSNVTNSNWIFRHLEFPWKIRFSLMCETKNQNTVFYNRSHSLRQPAI